MKLVKDTNSSELHLDGVDPDLLHAAFGIVTEAGELADILKKKLFYGKDIDFQHADEEVGDLLWYVTLYTMSRGRDLEEIVRENIKKLRSRYGDKWSQDAALNRDVEAEYEAMKQD